MAEAIATLSLACNVMQVISFTIEVIEICHSTFRDGSPDAGLASNTAQLSALAQTLQGSIDDFDSANASTPNVQDPQELQARNRLESVASSLVKDTKELQSLLQKVTTTSSDGRLQKLKVISNYKFKYKQKISSAEKRVRNSQDVLNSEFLNRLCSSTKAADARSEDRYKSLSGDIKQFIDRWTEGNRDISTLIAAEAVAIRTHIISEGENTRERIDQINMRLIEESLMEKRNRLLSTLHYPEMNARKNSIKNPSENTVEWIFHELVYSNWGTLSQELSWDSFLDWLQSDQRVYWIKGKPGSGKSTLVKFLIESEKTLEYLQKWNRSVRIHHFFFFELGSEPLQKNLEGCFRSLLHQVLYDQPTVLDKLLRTHSRLMQKISRHDWSLDELEQVLMEAVDVTESAFCLFLDGLDEIQEGERGTVVDLVQSLTKHSSIKVCVSSRPDTPFLELLGSYPMLQVQDLTRNTICAYCDEKLRDNLKRQMSNLKITVEVISKLADSLAYKSEGVFLWAVLAVQSVSRCAYNGDSWEALCQQAEEYKSGLSDLYLKIWTRQNSDDRERYRREAAEVFWLALNASEFKSPGYQYLATWQFYLLATWKDLHTEVNEGDMSYEEMERRRHRRYANWLSARTAGLLEAKNTTGFNGDSIVFIHRSVREFLLGTNDGKQILSYDNRPIRDKWLNIAKASYNWATEDLLPPLRSHQPLHLVMGIYASLGWDTRERELVSEFKAYIQSHSQSLILDLDFFKLAAESGCLAFISHAKAEIYDNITLEEQVEVLDCVSESLAYNLEFVPTIHKINCLLAREGYCGLSGSPTMFEHFRRVLSCAEWLLNAGPSFDGQEEQLRDAHEWPKVPHKMTSYSLFLRNVFIWFPYLSGDRAKEAAKKVLDCIQAFERHGANHDDQVYLLLRPDGQKNPKPDLVFRVKPEWLIEYFASFANFGGYGRGNQRSKLVRFARDLSRVPNTDEHKMEVQRLEEAYEDDLWHTTQCGESDNEWKKLRTTLDSRLNDALKRLPGHENSTVSTSLVPWREL